MGKNVVIVGGGSGGTIVANHLARELKDEIQNHEIKVSLITDTPNHVYQPSFLYVSINHARVSNYIRNEATLVKPNIDLVIDPATNLNAPESSLVTASGKKVSYDVLIIATGSYPDFTSVPGLSEGADTFYTAEGAEKLRDKLISFDGGTIVITVDVPHKCPAAPLEFTFMIDDFFRKKGIRDKVEIIYTYPIGRIHSLEPVANWALPEFEKRGIKSEIFFNTDTVDPQNKVVSSIEGSELRYDILVSTPAHTGAQVVRDSDLGDEDGFIPTDRHLLKAEGFDNIYVLGDATSLPVSKAGSTAHYQADIIVANVISELKGLAPSRSYDGKVACFVEAGLSEATFISFTYNKPPAPLPVSEMIHWYKLAFNEIYWLTARGMI